MGKLGARRGILLGRIVPGMVGYREKPQERNSTRFGSAPRFESPQALEKTRVSLQSLEGENR